MAMKVPITQSKEWQKLQEDLGETSFYETGKDFQYLAILKKTPIGNYLYCPYGPVAKDKIAFKKSLESLEKKARELSAIFIRIEPQNPDFTKVLPKNAQNSKEQNPKDTWVLDLKGNQEDLLQKLPSRLLRYHRNAAKNDIVIETSHVPSDINHLLELQKALATVKNINTFPKEYLQTELSQPFATLYLAKHQNPSGKKTEVIAAGLVFDDQTTRYNLQGAQNEQGRKLHATGILTIQLILDAKEKGLQAFDFWGIAPEGAPKNHPWAGFTSFKKTFAGKEVHYAGTYDIPVSSSKFNLYKFLRRINQVRRRA